MLFRFAGLKLEGLSDEQANAIRAGAREFMSFQRKHEAEANAQLEAAQANSGDGDIRLYRWLETTSILLMYAGTPENEGKLKAYMERWDRMGYPLVSEALSVRLAEARTPYEQEPEELSESDFRYIPEEEDDEEAPVTMRSVAKILRYVNVFYKVARG
jgi:hypothetical protein